MAKTSLAETQRVVDLGKSEKKKLAQKGEKAIDEFLQLKKASQHAFYEMGKLLAVLKSGPMIQALGYGSFSALCNMALRMSHDQADQLIAIATHFDPKIAAQLTPSKAFALIDLARAVGKKTTPEGILSRGTVTLPFGNKTLDVRAASASAIAAAAREIRRHSPAREKSLGGIRISKEDAAFLANVTRRLKSQGVRIDGIAAGQATGARMRISGRVADAVAIGEALIAAAKQER